MRHERHARPTLAAAACALALMLAAGAGAQEAAAPTVRVDFPALSAQEPMAVPPTVTLGFTGADADGPGGLPTRVRFLFTPAEYGPAGGEQPVTTRAAYEAHVDELIAWDDPDWSPWLPWPADPGQRRITFPALPVDRYFLFAVQAMDTFGAVSGGRGYQTEVAHILVQDGVYRPEVALAEYYMGISTAPLRITSIAPGQPLNFSWTASAAAYGGTIVSYRYGWDLVDPGDANDPGWSGPPGSLLRAPERTFNDGLHVFTLQVVDDSGQATLRQWQLSVVPFVDIMNQLELLLIDQTVDANVNNWPDPTGAPLNHESFRNAYWHFLADGSGGVQGFDWDRDRFDHRDMIGYADLVAYRTVLCYAAASPQQLMFNQLRPVGGVDRYVWLEAYQRGGGNLMLVGGGSMESLLEALPNYMTPLVFDTFEEYEVFNGSTFVVGFGGKNLPNGDLVRRGATMYPYATAGLATLDWTAASTKHVWGRPLAAMSQERHVDCVGLKALALDPDFRSRWLVGPGDLADTMRTEATIDWQDAVYAAEDRLDVIHNTFPFRNDEFVDANITTRATGWAPQYCPDDPDAPGGLCVEPMLRGVARFDWLREYKRAHGEPGWPGDGAHTPAELESLCGEMALAPYDTLQLGTARTNAKVFGWLSYKTTADKPSGAPDVYWGFDPYRFDHAQSRQMVRWVLDNVFRLNVNP